MDARKSSQGERLGAAQPPSENSSVRVWSSSPVLALNPRMAPGRAGLQPSRLHATEDSAPKTEDTGLGDGGVGVCI